MKINEILKLNEYGDVEWTWFTTNPKILIADYIKDMGQEVGNKYAFDYIADLKGAAGKFKGMNWFDGHWHELSEAPDRYEKIAKEGESVDITIVYYMGDPNTEFQSSYLESFVLEDAIIINKDVAAWYGDNTTWL